MTARWAAPLLLSGAAAGAPPGVDPTAMARAMVEDLHDMLAGLDLLETALLTTGDPDAIGDVVWPGTPVQQTSPRLADAAEKLAGLGAEQAVIVLADAPDLPAMLVGKALRALGNADVAYCPDESSTSRGSSGVVLAAVRLPCPQWVLDADVRLDSGDVVRRLHEAAPRRRSLAATPGWHRLTTPADVARLDPGLEGADVTRALLAGRPLRRPA